MPTIDRRWAPSVLLLLGIALLSCSEPPRAPNVVLILADDVGYGDLGAYGHPYAQTPSLDRLAAQGLRFGQFYVSGITCNPSRTGFMTGRFPATFENYTATRGFGESAAVSELLAAAGYRTGHFGKWHIGPVQKDGTYGFFEVSGGTGVKRKVAGGRDVGIFTAALDFIEEHRDVPFYVNIWSHIAHPPIKPSAQKVEEFPPFDFDRADFGHWEQENLEKAETVIERYGLTETLADAMRIYLAEIASLDDQVGRLLDKLDELGLSDDTIVAFSSDQGPAPVVMGAIGEARRIRKPRSQIRRLGSTAGLRGRKHSIYEGGVRVPFIVRWPGRIPAGASNETSILSAVDWLPTVCAFAGCQLDGDELALDGEDLSDLWLGAERQRTRPLFWKISSTTGRPTGRFGDWKLRRHDQRYELYNITEDPMESEDLSGRRPEIVSELGERLASWEATLPTSYFRGRARSPRTPVADAGPDRVLTDRDGDGRESLRLDAGASHDPDGELSGYVWRIDGVMVAVGRSPMLDLRTGLHRLTLEVTDYANLTAVDTAEVRVEPAAGS